MIPERVRRRPKHHGAAIVAVGLVTLVLLRFWASPVGRRITGRTGGEVLPFVGMVLVLGVVVAGIGVFLLEPADRQDA